jgi:septum formation protein
MVKLLVNLNQKHAFEIWQKLSGRWHDVLTGVCVANAEQILYQVVQTQVEFQPLTPNDMENYWATGEPVGKAGAYAIQGQAAQYIPRIEAVIVMWLDCRCMKQSSY